VFERTPDATGASGATQIQAAGGGAENAGAANVSGASGAGAGAANTGGVSGVSGAPATTPEYVPDHAQPFDQTYVEDGSFESSNGHGWDTCYSDTPGVLSRPQNNASDGTRSFEFTSGSCPNCSYDGPSDSQVYSWFTQQPTTALSLYFDIINISNTPPLGELRLETTDKYCRPLRPLTVIQLSNLLLEPTWQTRCVDLAAFDSDPALGVAITGASFDVALDALRLGPPCHAH
jgi:hypothetical protein